MTDFELRINRLAEEAKEELHQMDIHPSTEITAIRENRRAKKRLGCCRKTAVKGRETFVIELSTVLAETEDRLVKEVLIHELLHTCPSCFNHGRLWKHYAEKVNRRFGYQISTVTDMSRAGLSSEQLKTPKYRYEVRCTRCGNRFFRQKRSIVVTRPQNYRCAKCGGKLSVRSLEA